MGDILSPLAPLVLLFAARVAALVDVSDNPG